VQTPDGVLVVTGGTDGITGGLTWGDAVTSGRWEARVKMPKADPSYQALIALLPVPETAGGGEIDIVNGDPRRLRTDIVVRGADDRTLRDQVSADATDWHNWAVEWTPDRITAYLDGKVWYRVDRTSAFPAGPLRLALRLDWFPGGGAPRRSTMDVDWVRYYAIP
jgi:hypothetical protein